MSMFIVSKGQVLDNIEYFKQNSEADYVKCIQSLIVSRPFGNHKFYIYSFVKRIDDDAGIKKMLHQPRLTKPEPLPGTTLMRVDPNNPMEAKIIWTLPNQENFGLYKEGKMFQDKFVYDCVQTFLKSPKDFMGREEGDLSEEEIRDIYKGINEQAQRNKAAKEAKLLKQPTV